ncbi:hypothetical protein C2869_00185 [Saccharobesus litoralis]|uniref:Alpha amylase n=1 Tax=Saccharobesus litoralis TaxID=2172099 RepID=A0A2S0VL68_9ALTE|nr:hypothetical protein [Saccharobesus litoralis]AWB64953.1 hypothetical protein C2869_00185 [Saccharobesus litoralis]
MKHILKQTVFCVFVSLSFNNAVIAANNSHQGHQHNNKPHHQHNKHQHMDHSQHSVVSQAPISVMADHLHHKDGWMFSYRYMDMKMSGLQQGKDDISHSDALQKYMMLPKNMQMKMHMFGLMYGWSDEVTLMLMTHYLSNDMDSVMRMNNSAQNHGHMADMNMPMMFSTSSSGLGDSKALVLVNLVGTADYRIHYQFGLSLPTGDIDQTAQTPMHQHAMLGYPMQLGTGTYNVLGGVTGVWQYQQLQLGSQLNFDSPLSDNEQNYKPGREWRWHNWAGYQITQCLNMTLRLTWLDKANYSGQDPRLNPMMMPTADPSARGFEQIDIGLGVNYQIGQHRLSAEWSEASQLKVDGMQMANREQLVFAWQLSF